MRGSWKLAVATLACIGVLASGMVLAQTYGHEQQDQGTTMSQGMRAQGADNHLNWLSQQLSLTDTQKAQLQPILQSQQQQMMQVRDDTSLSQEQKRDRMKQIHQSSQSQINGILTPDQQQKFTQLQEQERQKHAGQMGNDQNEPK